MPAYITHALLGDDLLRQLPPEQRALAERNFHSYALGLQGPDILFFRGVAGGGSPLNQYGGLMHCDKTDLLFAKLADYCAQRKGQGDEELILAYALGFIGHYALDSVCHPYIYSLQERMKKTLPPRVHTSVHHSIEGMIDSALYRLRYYRAPHRFPFDRYFTRESRVTAPIALLYQYLLQEVYGITVPAGEISLSIRDTYTFARLELDPTGGLLIGAANLLERCTGQLNKQSCFLKKTPTFDVLNLNRQKWAPLFTSDCPVRTTFPELMWEAESRALALERDFTAALQTQQPYRPKGLASFDAGSPASH